jgi:hypothetical protein
MSDLMSILSNSYPEDNLLQLLHVLTEAKKHGVNFVAPLDIAMCTGLDPLCIDSLCSHENQAKAIIYIKEYLAEKQRLLRRINNLEKDKILYFEQNSVKNFGL